MMNSAPSLTRSIISAVNARHGKRDVSFRFQLARLTRADARSLSRETARKEKNLLPVIDRHSRVLDMVVSLERLARLLDTGANTFEVAAGFHDLVIRIAKEHGLLDGCRLIYPASGIDVIPARYAKTIMIDHRHLAMEMRITWEAEDAWEGNATVVVMDAGNVRKYPRIKNERKLLLLKGLCSWMCVIKKPEDSLEGEASIYLGKMDEIMMRGDRVLILDQIDSRICSPFLAGSGYKRVDDWMDRQIFSRITASMNLMNKRGCLITSPCGTIFMMPNDLVLFEKD